MIAPLMCKMIIGDQDFVKQFLLGGFCLILIILRKLHYVHRTDIIVI